MLTDFFSGLNWAGVIVATLAWFGFSSVWYSLPPLSSAWARAAGVERGEESEAPRLVTFLIPTVVFYLLASIVIALIAEGIGADTAEEGVVLGLGLGVAFGLIQAAIHPDVRGEGTALLADRTGSTR